MSILSGLESFGFRNADRKVFEDEADTKETVEEKQEKKENILREEDVLFPKTYRCPVCDNSFKSLAVRAGKIHSTGQDDDLRPRYDVVDPIKYDAIVCPHCGYSAIARYFDYIMPLQGKKLRSEVMSKFKGMELSVDKYSYEEAITHYKMVLMCDIVGGVTNSRKAYTCLKMAWVIRGWLEAEGDQMAAAKKNSLEADEQECIRNAYEGYVKAFSTETFPMSGMDELTLSYLLAELAFALGNYKDSLKMLVNVLGNKNASPRIKDKALSLKEQIRGAVK
ncbi:MAG: DUF2225 domain-containing protein [Lachnospiraceae bacterium]